ncbi:hypothetical protein [Peptoniphilus stercorisuis]|uniref:Adenylosuccinate synthase n=1 Tax=Peptoniphilus stercorisuis TaxID=1436965 RepID=A0ABS4KBK0_9FIRM|nr:hypothetical protein [Peptoniphilus stercorisuis]MBP2024621.1 adenylosuccinate synthase [Peptoniphilus stercorisuis]
MKERIEGILEIDKKTQDITERTEIQIEKDWEDLRVTLTDMENKSNERAKKIAQEKFDEILKEAEEKVDKRKSENEESLKKVDVLFEKNKEILLEEAFNRFILGKEE